MKNKAKEEFHRFKRRIKLLFKIINSSEIRSLPSSLAYYLILSFFPLIALLGYISSLFNVSVSNVLDTFKSTSIQLSGFLNTIINTNGVPLNTAIYAITALILSGNGAYSIIVTSNELYHVKEKNILRRRVKSFFLILILISIFIFTIIVLGFGNTIFSFIINNTTFGEKIDQIFPFFLLFKYPLSFLAIFVCIKLIYIIAPDLKIPSKSINKGALFTTIGWILTTFIYSYYVSNFANYDRFYGSLAGVIVLFIWTYIIAYILVIGIAINTNNYHLDKEETSINKE